MSNSELLRPPVRLPPGHGPVIIAHRGGSLEAPENTVASVTHGVAVGSDWQEIDVTLTADEHLVVIHDDTLDRTTDGTGALESQPWSAIAGLRAGNPRWSPGNQDRLKALQVEIPSFGDTFADETVPRLEQILRIPGARLMIEIKQSPRGARLAELVVRAVHAAHMQQRVALGSFDKEIVAAVHRLDPSLPLIGIIEDPEQIPPMLALPLTVLAVGKPLLDAARAQIPKTVALWVWTAYKASEAQDLVARGADGIITDAPSHVMQVCRATLGTGATPPTPPLLATP